MTKFDFIEWLNSVIYFYQCYFLKMSFLHDINYHCCITESIENVICCSNCILFAKMQCLIQLNPILIMCKCHSVDFHRCYTVDVLSWKEQYLSQLDPILILCVCDTVDLHKCYTVDVVSWKEQYLSQLDPILILCVILQTFTNVIWLM